MSSFLPNIASLTSYLHPPINPKSPIITSYPSSSSLTTKRIKIFNLLNEIIQLSENIVKIGIVSYNNNKNSSRLRDSLIYEREKLSILCKEIIPIIEKYLHDIKSYNILKNENKAYEIIKSVEKDSMLKSIASEWNNERIDEEEEEKNNADPEFIQSNENETLLSKSNEDVDLDISSLMEIFKSTMEEAQTALKKSAFVSRNLKSNSSAKTSPRIDSVSINKNSAINNLTPPQLNNDHDSNISVQARAPIQDEIDHAKLLIIEKQVVELSQLFQEVQSLVQIQGAQVDTLEDNINSTKAYTFSAFTDLKHAAYYKAGTYAVCGGLIGAAIGGPVGAVVGAKAGVIAMSAIAGASALVGGFSGYIAGQYFAKGFTETHPKNDEDSNRIKKS